MFLLLFEDKMKSLGIFIFLLVGLIVGTSIFCATYWVTLSAFAALIVFSPLLLLHPRRSTPTLRGVVKGALKSRLLQTVFLALLLVYFLLYYITPAYFMPYVDAAHRRLRDLVIEIIGNATDDLEKARRIYEWEIAYLTNVYRSYKIDNYIVILDRPPYVCLRIIGEDCPLWPLQSRCGACMEYSLLFRELASAANLTVRSVHNPGEDHNWDEVLVDGRWIIVDPGWPLFNPSPSFYEKARGVNVSYVYARYPNGTIVNVTDRYTSTGTLKVIVIYSDGRPVVNSIIEFYSLNLRDTGMPIVGITCTTDAEGLCQIQLGGGKYRVRAVVWRGAFG